MNRAKIIFAIFCCLTISACAARREVIIDPKGVDMQRYEADLADCRQVARQVQSSAGGKALGGAVVGGLVGAVIGNRHTAETGAKLGAIGGASRGGQETHQERLLVMKNCMRDRGYRVLN